MPMDDNCSIVPLHHAAPVTAAAGLSRLGVRIIEIANPFRMEERVISSLAPLTNESLGAFLCRAGYAEARFEVSVNGSRVHADEVWRTPVVAGQEVVLFPRAGGHGFLKGIGMILLSVTVGLLSWGIGLYLGMAIMGMTIAQATLLGAVIGMAGNMLVSWALSPGQPSAQAYSLTYDPTGPKGLAQPGTPVPKAYGTFGWKGNIVSSFVNFDGPNAYIYALVSYGFGHAVSVGNILLNGKPISEYANCSYYVRLGTNDQAPIDGFNKTVNGYPQETQLLVANGSVVVPGTGTDVQGLEVTVKFPSGLYRITNDGNQVPLKLIYKFEISPHNLDQWTAPLYPWETQTIVTTHEDGSQTYPQWVVVPTDRFAGSGIVYDSINFGSADGQYAGMPWAGTMEVSVVDMYGNRTDTSATFKGEWQLCDPSLEQLQVDSWFQGYRMVEQDNLSPFFDTISIYGLTPGQWDLRVTKIGYEQDDQQYNVNFADSTDSKHICDVWLWNVNEVTFSDLAYPNMILVGVQALATSQMSGADLQVQATIVHDLGEDTVVPGALSTFEHDNPAIVAYDVLTNPLYGMGVAAANIDLPAFAAWAEFCDELVTNQDASQVRRFIFNGVFDQSSDAWKTLQTIGNMSRAAVLQVGMRYTVVLDAPADPVQLFTVGNTKKGSFRETWLSLDDRTTLIECDFADAARNYRIDLPASVMTEADLNSGLSPKPTRTKLIGCTSRDQAWRWSYFHLLSTKLSLRTVQFEAAIEACCCRPGSVIAVQSDVTQWASGGRIQPGSTLSTVNIDRNDLTFAAAAGWTVSVQHPSIQRGTGTISSIAGLVVTMTAALPAGRILKAVGPDGKEYIVTGTGGSSLTLSAVGALAAGQIIALYDVNVIEQLDVTAYAPNDSGATLTVQGNFSAAPVTDCAWAYGQSAGNQPAKLFRVTQMKKSGDFDFQISGLEYNSTIYADVTPNYGEIVGVPNSTPAITNLSLTEQYQSGALTGSANTALVAVGWQNGNTAVGAKVEVQSGSGAFQLLGNIAGQGCTFSGYTGTTYTVRVTGFDWQGNPLGDPAVASITVVAATNAPANVTGFTGLASATDTALSWNAAAGADHYEIRWAQQVPPSTWDDAAVLWDGTGVTWTDATVRSGMYLIVAVSSAATGSVESVTPAVLASPQSTQPPASAAGTAVSVNISQMGTVNATSDGSDLQAAAPTGTYTVGGVTNPIPAGLGTEGSTPDGNRYYGWGVIDSTGKWTVLGSGRTIDYSLITSYQAAGDVIFQLMWGPQNDTGGVWHYGGTMTLYTS